MRIKPNSSTIELASLIGKSEKEAVTTIAAAGMIPRVVYRNGQSFMGTAEYRPDRMNLRIEDDKVIKVTIG